MSLLMEALRKAEEAKRLAQEGASPTTGSPDTYLHLKKKPLSQQSSLEDEGEFPPREGDTDAIETIAFTPGGADPATPEAAGTDDEVRRYLSTRPQQEDMVLPREAPATPPPLPEAETPSNRNVRPRIKVEPATAKQGAAAVFAAKQASPQGSRTTMVILVGALIALIPVGGGLYWYLAQPSSGVMVANNLPPPPQRFLEDVTPAAATAAQPVTTQVADGTPTDTGTTATPAVTPAPDATPAVVASPADAGNQAPDIAAATDDVIPADPESGTPVATTVAEPPPVPAPQAAGDTPQVAAADDSLALPQQRSAPNLSITRSNGTPRLHPQLSIAYGSLQRGDYAGAGLLYQEVLVDEPANRDALLGLATVQARQGNNAGARQLYSRLLQLNPRDALAHAGLLQELANGGSLEQETELKSLVDQYPDVAQLPFALGNFYAAQRRWSEAQGAYFNALLLARRGGAEPSPDYAFNLAVSLEQLGQSSAALDYYRQAERFAAASSPGFDMNVLRQRLRYLEQQTP